MREEVLGPFLNANTYALPSYRDLLCETAFQSARQLPQLWVLRAELMKNKAQLRQAESSESLLQSV